MATSDPTPGIPSADEVAKATSELNNLLHIISGTSSAIEDIVKDTGGAAKYIDMLRTSIDRAEKVAQDLARQAGGVADKFKLQPGLAPFLKLKKAKVARPEKQTVLLVDDERMALSLIERVLTEAGFAVATAQSGFECIDLFRAHPYRFAMVLLDLSLPFMDGEETFRRLREIRNDVPVVLCTGFIQEDRLSRMMAAGLSGFLRKPIAPDEIVAVVQSTLKNARYTDGNLHPGEIPAAG
jgi:CheY-like chemotaxis protein